MKPSDQDQTSKKDHFVVGIGASAGGLEPIHQLFDHMPPDTGFSFILVQHLSPDHKSLMRDLLGRHTEMEILEAADGMRLEPDRVYLLPSNKVATVSSGKFQLRDKDRGVFPNMTIDVFFSSLAREKKQHAVGIILSGSGGDGSKGIQAIKDNGGWVVVQDPVTADFDSMPLSAINSGKVDLILPPEMMAQELTDFLREVSCEVAATFNEEEEAAVERIVSHIRELTPHDFSQYKKPTIKRRLAKRMMEKGYNNVSEYADFLKENGVEANTLVSEFLINVTRFFRDPEAFLELQDKVLPSIFAGKLPSDTIKIWVVACSTGEEAYSLAMLVNDYMVKNESTNHHVKIFATDIDRDAINFASLGVYPATIADDISPELINRYFTKEGNGYKIIPSIRKMVVFAPHDVSADPPFSKLDLVSCRNLLIYMNTNLQKNVLRTFLFALQNGGYLFLGTSENAAVLKDSMKEISKKWKIYQCTGKSRLLSEQPLYNTFQRKLAGNNRAKNAYTHLDEIFKDTLLEESRYAGILIDENMEVKHAIGRFKDYLTFHDNSFSFNLLKLVDRDLGAALSMSVRKVLQENRKSVMKGIRMGEDEEQRTITIIVKPYVQQREYQQSFLFIILQEEDRPASKRSRTKGKSNDSEHSRIEELEKELRETKENLQTLIEEMESANEELMTSNEEMISANEELQSTNEELQSLNEELHTVSSEHQAKIKELIDLNDDLINYFENSEVGQILVDKQMRIRRFSPAVTKMVNLIDSDIGRSIADITNNLEDVNLVADIQRVMNTQVPVKKEVTTGRDKTFLMKINSYVRQDRSTDGVMITFLDVSEVKSLNGIINGVFESSKSGITALKAIRNGQDKIHDFEYTATNSSAEKIFGFERGVLVGKKLKELDGKSAVFFDKYVEVVETGREERFEHYNESSMRWYDVIVVKMSDGIVTTFTDITQKKRAADIITKSYEDLKVTSSQLQETNQKLEQSNMDLLQFASVASHDLKEPLRKIQTFGNFLSARIEGKLDASEKNYLDKIINASQRMQLLIEDVLTLSKLSNKDIPFVPTDLNAIVRRIVDDLEITIREKNGDIQLESLPQIAAVPGQMHQLFQNLISNALKFNKNDRPMIRIQQRGVSKEEEVEFGIDAEEYVVICVRDNGIGFEEKFSEKIFGLFQRLNPTQYQGTGIGLAICKKIVDNHNGFIKAESHLDHESTFILFLPKAHINLRKLEF